MIYSVCLIVSPPFSPLHVGQESRTTEQRCSTNSSSLHSSNTLARTRAQFGARGCTTCRLDSGIARYDVGDGGDQIHDGGRRRRHTGRKWDLRARASAGVGDGGTGRRAIGSRSVIGVEHRVDDVDDPVADEDVGVYHLRRIDEYVAIRHSDGDVAAAQRADGGISEGAAVRDGAIDDVVLENVSCRCCAQVRQRRGNVLEGCVARREDCNVFQATNCAGEITGEDS